MNYLYHTSRLLPSMNELLGAMKHKADTILPADLKKHKGLVVHEAYTSALIDSLEISGNATHVPDYEFLLSDFVDLLFSVANWQEKDQMICHLSKEAVDEIGECDFTLRPLTDIHDFYAAYVHFEGSVLRLRDGDNVIEGAYIMSSEETQSQTIHFITRNTSIDYNMLSDGADFLATSKQCALLLLADPEMTISEQIDDFILSLEIDEESQYLLNDGWGALIRQAVNLVIGGELISNDPESNTENSYTEGFAETLKHIILTNEEIAMSTDEGTDENIEANKRWKNAESEANLQGHFRIFKTLRSAGGLSQYF
jgi:hypothetical protein